MVVNTAAPFRPIRRTRRRQVQKDRTMDAMIEAKGLKRTYKARGKSIEAVRGIDLRVNKGEIVGFLGPNGAGKTTTLKMLATLLEPTGGAATVAGSDLRADAVGVRRKIGYVSQAGSTSPEARAGEEIMSHAELYGIDRATAKQRGQKLLAALDLSDVWDRACGSLSGGQKRRLDIVMGLIHSPRLVFLDEPTTGLDPQARANLWEHISGLRDHEGATVFLTTHYLDEADTLADRIVIIDRGEIVASDTADNLKANVSGDLVSLEVAADEQVASARDKLGSLTDAVSVDGRVVSGRVSRAGKAVPGLLRDLESSGVVLDSIEVIRPTLDDVFLTLTGRSLRDADAADAPETEGEPV